MNLEMKYFVLKPRGNNVYARASRMAMREYAMRISKENESLSEDLFAWAYREQELAQDEPKGGE